MTTYFYFFSIQDPNTKLSRATSFFLCFIHSFSIYYALGSSTEPEPSVLVLVASDKGHSPLGKKSSRAVPVVGLSRGT